MRPADEHVIEYVKNNPDCNIKQLAKAMDCHAATARNVAQELHMKGLITIKRPSKKVCLINIRSQEDPIAVELDMRTKTQATADKESLVAELERLLIRRTDDAARIEEIKRLLVA